MYDYMIGQVARMTPEYIVLEQGGIGYRLFTPNSYAKSTNSIHTLYLHAVGIWIS